MTIVCACIPVLRPLYVRLKYGSRGDSSGGRSYPLNDYSKKGSGGFPSKGNSGGNSKIYMGPGESALHTTVKYGDDNASEESILRDQKHGMGLPIQNFDGSDGIKRTDEIRVTTTTYQSSQHSPV